MTIAEFFVTLGVKGEGSAKKAISGVDGALKEVKSTSLEAKAAIVGVIYGLERMMSQSAQAGTGLQQFAAFTGESLEQLQRWQYAGRQFGVSAEEVEASIKGVQSAMAQMRLTGNAPSGLNFLATTVGLTDADLDKPFVMMKKLQELAKQQKGAIGNEVLKSFGLGDSMIGSMRKDAYNDEAFAKALVYTEKQAESLRKVNAMWGNFGDRMQKAFGSFTSKHGAQLIGDIEKIATAFMNLATAIITVAEKLKLFDLLGQSITGWAMLLKGNFGGKGTLNKDEEGFMHLKGLNRFFKGMREQGQEEFEINVKKDLEEFEKGDSWLNDMTKDRQPKSPPTGPGASMQFEQNLYFENSDQPHENANAQRTAASQAFRQFNVGQVS